jgi:antitoxin Phd
MADLYRWEDRCNSRPKAQHAIPWRLYVRNRAMREIQLKDAKASLSSLVDDATRGETSIITRHGKPEAVIVGFDEWQRLAQVPSFGRLLMSAPLEAKDLQRRNRKPMRRAKL